MAYVMKIREFYIYWRHIELYESSLKFIMYGKSPKYITASHYRYFP